MMTDDSPIGETLDLPGAPEAIRFACAGLRRMVDDGEISDEAAAKVSVLLGMFAADLTKGIREKVRLLEEDAALRVGDHSS